MAQYSEKADRMFLSGVCFAAFPIIFLMYPVPLLPAGEETLLQRLLGGKSVLLPACEVKSLNTLFLFLEYFFRFLLCVCFKKNGGIIDNTKETIIFVARRKHHE